ncbi:MAG: hypothetical protein IJL74_02290 [Bacilli bacterium]|nr:hypothetical protein [Bacilli bacterium]
MKKFILVFILSLFTFYVILLLAQSQGYYKTRSEKAKILTDEQIEKFEKDVQNGKNIDITEYTIYKDKDYTNDISTNIYKVSLKLETVVDKTIKLIFNSASRAVSD